MLLSDYLIAEGYEITPLGKKQMDEHEHETNGCGAGFISRYVAGVVQAIYGKPLYYSCLIHDMEWNIPKSLKNEKHRIQSDSNLDLNLILDIGKGGITTTKLRIAAWFHAAVVINSPTAYWED